jgi:hypothetical protein
VLSYQTVAQQGNVWVFGDSAYLDINQPNQPLRSGGKFFGGTSSIANNAGDLLFYAVSTVDLLGLSVGFIYNKQNQIMTNGNGIRNRNIFHSNLIIPWPDHDSLYYLFHTSILYNNEGIYYSLINPIKNNVGEVIQKNVSIQSNAFPTDVLSAVKHGNGRDWWVFWRNYDIPGLDTTPLIQMNNAYYRVLLSTSGIGQVDTQNIGALGYLYSYGDLSFSKDGTKAAYCGQSGMLEIFDFNRCTGLFYNPIAVSTNTLYNGYTLFSAEFSASGQYLYICETVPDSSFIYQYDLYAGNIFASRIVIDTIYFPEQIGTLERWVDDKIYISKVDSTLTLGGYADSTYTITNTHLSVINNPDLPFPQCNYVSNGFYLNGARGFQSLPNNPNYDLGVAAGSPCDTLSVGIAENNSEQNEIKISPNPVSYNLMLSYKLNQSKQAVVYIYDLLGKLVFSQQIYSSGTQLLIHTENFQKGMYVISVEDNGKRMNKKFIKE